MLTAFIDDSGSGGDSTFVVLAGYVGTVQDWELFVTEWQYVLDAEPKIDSFKSSEAESLKGQFAGLSRAQANSKIENLIEVINRNARQSIEVMVRQSDYNQIIKGRIAPIYDNPYFVLFLGFIISAGFLEVHLGDRSHIDFVFDNQDQFEKPSANYADALREWGRLGEVFGNVHYRDDKNVLPLQAADLLAWQVRRRVCTNEPGRAHLEMARKGYGKYPAHQTIIDREVLIKTRDDMVDVAMKRMDLNKTPDANRG